MAKAKLPDDIQAAANRAGAVPQESAPKTTRAPRPPKKQRKRGLWITLAVIIVIVGLVITALARAGILLGNISTSERSIFGQFIDVVRDGNLQKDEDGIINIAVFGMRGTDEDGSPLPGGSTLTDTNMVIRIQPDTKKVAMISIPRDLVVTIPEHSYEAKINSAYAVGEQEEKGKGMTLAIAAMEEVTGLEIPYVVTADFYAFQEVIDALGGVEVTLDKPFSEPSQFEGEGMTNFTLPAGTQTLNGEEALFYTRARYASSDFDRARRQQQVLEAIKDKALANGVVSNPSQVRKLLSALEGNIKTNMTLAEMEAFLKILKDNPNPDIVQKVFDTSDEGLLYSTKNSSGSYILLPEGDDFSKIHIVIKNIFTVAQDEPDQN